MRGPGSAAITLGVLLLGATGISAQSPSASSAPSPSPSSAVSPAPSLALTSRGEASDDRFLLTIQTDATQVATGGSIDITTVWAHTGGEPIDIATSMAGPITFVVEQLDGPFDPGGASDDGCRLTTVQPGTVEPVPFQKSGGYDASDPMAPQYAAWFADPDLRLPVGLFRITAHAEYAVDDCAPSTTLDASVVIQVVAAAATPSPSPGAPAAFAWPTLAPAGDVPLPRALRPAGRPTHP